MLWGARFQIVVICAALLVEFGSPVRAAENPPQTDPWTPGQLLNAKQLSAILSGSSKPEIVYVGFPVLYRGAHITGAILAGPASKPEGLDDLRKLVREWRRDRPIVLYCGCCPFQQCPNIRPAFRAVKNMGFEHVQVLMVETNLHSDWVTKGYPTERGEGR